MTQTNVYLEVKDHSVSGESFQLIHDIDLDLLQTSPQPSEEKLPSYYNTEDYISHTDSKRNLFEKAYHLIRNISLNRKLNLINSFNTTGKNVLDIGCGTGDFLLKAKQNGWTTFGVEPNAQARKIANDKTNNSVQDIEQLNEFENHSFDVITLWHVLEHLPNLEEHITRIQLLLKPKGRLIIAVPNYKSYDAMHYKSFWAAFDVPRHLWHFSKTSISKLFGKVNMKVESIKPLKFDAFYVALLSEKYKSGSMKPVSAFYHGLRSNLKAKRNGEYSSLIYILKND